MLSKNKIKYIRSLSLSKFRTLHREFISEGTKVVSELVKSPIAVSDIFVTQRWADDNSKLHLSFSYEIITENEMKLISQLSTPPGVLAIAAIPTCNLEINKIQDDLCLVLDGINDPGNLGTIIRTADWFGVRHIICSLDTVDAYHPKVVQSTMGSLFRIHVYETELSSFLNSVKSQNISIFGAVMQGANIYKTQLSIKSSFLIIGSESHGIRDYILPFINYPITFPAFSKNYEQGAESLNASIATALILGEFRRISNNS